MRLLRSPFPPWPHKHHRLTCCEYIISCLKSFCLLIEKGFDYRVLAVISLLEAVQGQTYHDRRSDVMSLSNIPDVYYEDRR